MIGGTLRIGDLHPRSSFRSTSSTARTNAVRLKGTTTISRGTAGVAWPSAGAQDFRFRSRRANVLGFRFATNARFRLWPCAFPSGACRRNHLIENQRALEQVRALRARRYTPAEIARSLAISKAEATRLVRIVAIESGTGTADAGETLDQTRCWVNPGWRHRLRIEGHEDWLGDAGAPSQGGDSGVALVLVAKPVEDDRLTLCSYLIDTWCLGVKNAIGPKPVGRRELEALRRRCYAPWRSPGISIPLELAQHLVLGAVEFARRLGLEPHRDFKRARFVLGSWEGPSAITFGMAGMPHYINGPYEDPQRVLATLERTVGRGGFHYTVSLGDADDLGDGYRYSAVLTNRGDHLSDVA